MINKIVHTLDYCIQRDLKDCQSVLDLGCGPSSPIKNCKNIKYSVGVEIFKKYLNLSKKQKIHTKYLNQDILSLDFPKKSFDAVILIEVLEHLSKKDGKKVIKLASNWAKNKVIISTPNEYFPMESVDKNTFQKHLSGWSTNELSKYGFKCHGVSGLKYFYTSENKVDSLIEGNNYTNIKFKPKKLFYYINGILQIFTYFIPKIAFGIYAVKNV